MKDTFSTTNNGSGGRPLSSLKEGEWGIIESLNTPWAISQKLLEMGLVPGEMIRAVRKAPFGDPVEYEIMDCRVAIRKTEAEKIKMLHNF